MRGLRSVLTKDEKSLRAVWYESLSRPRERARVRELPQHSIFEPINILEKEGPTMEITLDANEVDVVGRTLRNFLGDLRMEISNTEKYDLRQSLKADEML